MRLPRVRFEVGTLLLIVAVAALNFATLPRLLSRDSHQTGFLPTTMPYSDPSLDLGLLPLANVAVVGTLWLVARRLRLVRVAPAGDGRGSVPAITFFSVHLLILALLLRRYAPGGVPGLQEGCRAIFDPVARAWNWALGPPGEAAGWLALSGLILGVVVSGPPLVVAWLGKRLATRYAARSSPGRFRAVAWLVTFGFAAAALAICIQPHPFINYEQPCELNLRVVDRDTGRPVPSAFVKVSRPIFDNISPDFLTLSGFTDGEGRARLSGLFSAEGERNAFGEMGTIWTWGRWLEVKATGYRDLRIALPEVVSAVIDIGDSRPRQVELTRGVTPAKGFADLSGSYLRGWRSTYLEQLNIEPDGRFSSTSRNNPFNLSGYGQIKKEGEEFDLVAVPKPGWDSPARRLRLVEWGDCRYLCDSADKGVYPFCRAALLPQQSRQPGDEYGGLLLSFDTDKIPTGLPRLPLATWWRFLRDDDSLYRRWARFDAGCELIVRGIVEDDPPFNLGPFLRRWAALRKARRLIGR